MGFTFTPKSFTHPIAAKYFERVRAAGGEVLEKNKINSFVQEMSEIVDPSLWNIWIMRKDYNIGKGSTIFSLGNLGDYPATITETPIWRNGGIIPILETHKARTSLSDFTNVSHKTLIVGVTPYILNSSNRSFATSYGESDGDPRALSWRLNPPAQFVRSVTLASNARISSSVTLTNNTRSILVGTYIDNTTQKTSINKSSFVLSPAVGTGNPDVITPEPFDLFSNIQGNIIGNPIIEFGYVLNLSVNLSEDQKNIIHDLLIKYIDNNYVIEPPRYIATRFVFEGDSITYGVGAAPYEDYPSQFMNYPNYVNSGIYHNVAITTQNVPELTSQYATQVGPLKPSGFVSGSYLFISIGTKDVQFSGASGTATGIFSTLTGYWNIAKNDGFKLIALTQPVYVNYTTGQQAEMSGLNTLIMNSNIPDYKLDVATLLGPPPLVGSGFYFADGIHPNASGYALIASGLNNLNII